MLSECLRAARILLIVRWNLAGAHDPRGGWIITGPNVLRLCYKRLTGRDWLIDHLRMVLLLMLLMIMMMEGYLLRLNK